MHTSKLLKHFRKLKDLVLHEIPEFGYSFHYNKGDTAEPIRSKFL